MRPADCVRILRPFPSSGPTRLLKPGATIPHFALPNELGEIVRSEDLLADGPLVLFFYIADFTPG